jgi:hypothetical protein
MLDSGQRELCCGAEPVAAGRRYQPTNLPHLKPRPRRQQVGSAAVRNRQTVWGDKFSRGGATLIFQPCPSQAQKKSRAVVGFGENRIVRDMRTGKIRLQRKRTQQGFLGIIDFSEQSQRTRQ